MFSDGASPGAAAGHRDDLAPSDSARETTCCSPTRTTSNSSWTRLDSRAFHHYQLYHFLVRRTESKFSAVMLKRLFDQVPAALHVPPLQLHEGKGMLILLLMGHEEKNIAVVGLGC